MSFVLFGLSENLNLRRKFKKKFRAGRVENIQMNSYVP